MNKRIVIIVILTIVLTALATYAFILSRQTKEEQKMGQDQPLEINQKIDHGAMVRNYEESIKIAASDFAKIIKEVDAFSRTTEPALTKNELLAKIKAKKELMMNIKLPSEYRDMHMNMFLGLVFLEKYVNEGDLDAKSQGEKLFVEVFDNNSWLTQ